MDDRWGRFRSHRFGLSVPLPDGATWKIDDHNTPWLDAVHRDTATRFRARVWIEPRPVSRATCEAMARRWLPELPHPNEGVPIDDHVIVDVPAGGFETQVLVGLGTPRSPDEALTGYVLAFGVSAKKCIAMAFTSSATGPKASATLGERLELGARIVETTLLVETLPRGPLAPFEGR